MAAGAVAVSRRITRGTGIWLRVVAALSIVSAFGGGAGGAGVERPDGDSGRGGGADLKENLSTLGKVFVDGEGNLGGSGLDCTTGPRVRSVSGVLSVALELGQACCSWQVELGGDG